MILSKRSVASCITVKLAKGKGEPKVEVQNKGKMVPISISKFTKLYRCSESTNDAIRKAVMDSLCSQKLDIYK